MFQNWKTPIWFYRTPVDFRKQIDGLVMLIADHLSMTPSSGQLFLFLKTTQNLNQQNNAEILCKNDYALSF